MGNMDERDYDTYMGLFDSMMKVIKMPELMVYLRASVPHLVKNIQKRGRDYEQQMPIDYLQGINNLYDEFIYKKYKGKVLVIEVDNLDFEHNPVGVWRNRRQNRLATLRTLLEGGGGKINNNHHKK